jgi:hypothetical protein
MRRPVASGVSRQPAHCSHRGSREASAQAVAPRCSATRRTRAPPASVSGAGAGLRPIRRLGSHDAVRRSRTGSVVPLADTSAPRRRQVRPVASAVARRTGGPRLWTTCKLRLAGSPQRTGGVPSGTAPRGQAAGQSTLGWAPRLPRPRGSPEGARALPPSPPGLGRAVSREHPRGSPHRRASLRPGPSVLRHGRSRQSMQRVTPGSTGRADGGLRVSARTSPEAFVPAGSSDRPKGCAASRHRASVRRRVSAATRFVSPAGSSVLSSRPTGTSVPPGLAAK